MRRKKRGFCSKDGDVAGQPCPIALARQGIGGLGIVEGGLLVAALAFDRGNGGQRIRRLLNSADDNLVILGDGGIKLGRRAPIFRLQPTSIEERQMHRRA